MKLLKKLLSRGAKPMPGTVAGNMNPASTAKPLIKASLDENLDYVRKSIGHSTDIIIRETRIGQNGVLRMGIVFTEGLADKSVINDFIMESLMLEIKTAGMDTELSRSAYALQVIKTKALTIGDIAEVADYETMLHSILSGDTIILLDGNSIAINASTRGWKDRGVTETSKESVVRGPRESFSETLRTNTALIRRKIKDPNLWLETRQIGRVTKTDVAIMYINGIANDKIVDEVRARLARIDIDSILESGYIEELIQDETYTPFPTIYNSERPDVIAAELVEGKIAILVDGTPVVLVVPALFVSFLHSAEDYYHRFDISSLVRILRYVGVFIALLGPSLYVAITTFHQEMLPTELLIGLASQREGVPFPAFIEAIMMEIAFEILREAGLRMPRTIGPAVSVVGTLVIGQAAVEAGIVSAAMVIVVSTTAIASFVFPSYSLANSFRMLRFPLMGLAASFGLVGVIVGLIGIVLHLTSLRTFGIPYMSPFAPLIIDDQKDAIFRFPQWVMFSRPRLINQRNVIRQKLSKPEPKQSE